jgi:predicted DNA-binding transcriptional regulator AlpA
VGKSDQEAGYVSPLIRITLGPTEVAESIGVSVASVDKMVREGALPRPRIWHSRKLWLVSEIEAYLSEWPTDEDEVVDLG